MNRLNLITLGTKNIVKAHQFFKELGFDTSIRGTETNPVIIFFRNEGTRIALYPLEELAKISTKTTLPPYRMCSPASHWLTTPSQSRKLITY